MTTLLDKQRSATSAIQNRSPSRLSPLQRAYLMGFRRAQIQARCDVNRLEDQFEAMREKLRCVRREMAHLRSIDHDHQVRARRHVVA